MNLKTSCLAMLIAAALFTNSAFAERDGTGAPEPGFQAPPAGANDTSFLSEAEFLQKFGSVAEKTGTGTYQINQYGRQLSVSFGLPAVEAAKHQLAAQIDALRLISSDLLTPDQAGDLARMEKRQEQLTRRANQLADRKINPPPSEQCGFALNVAAIATRSSSSATAQSYAAISPGAGYGTLKHDWRLIADLWATVGAPNGSGGLTGRVDDHDGVDTYSAYVSPTPQAQVTLPGFVLCARATAFVEVIRDSGNPWFPIYCANPVNLVEYAYNNDPACPSEF